MKNKNIVLIIAILLTGVLVAGGTYAYLTSSLNVTNGNYVSATTCFNIDYTIDNGDSTQDITGTLFPSATASGGLSGRVGIKVNSSCSIDGLGTINLHVNSGVSSSLMTAASSYCENRSTLEPISGVTTKAACDTAHGRWRGYGDEYCESNDTLERLTSYTSSSDCTSNGGTWKSGGSPLKYAIYDNDAATGTPLAKGYILSTDIGNDKTIYEKFTISTTQKYYYIFIWYDGYLSNNNGTTTQFSAYINASAIQVNNAVPSGYQRVSYIQSSGTQYINTQLDLFSTDSHRIVIDFTPTEFYNYNTIWGSSYNADTFESWIYSSGSLAARYNGTRYGADNTITVNQRYLFDLRRDGTALSKYLNNSLIGSGSVASKITDANFYLFLSGSDYGKYKLYNCKLYKDGELVRNFVPAKQGNVVGLYDNINDVFYTNAGSGSFTAGPNA